MDNFRTYLTDDDYQITSSSMECKGFYGIVWIEDASDLVFWENFLQIVFSDRTYELTPASRVGGGKRALEPLYNNANERVLVAVDSDYDYILSHLDENHPFNQNRYILHTFAYSRECVQIEKSHLQTFFQRTKFTIAHQVNIDNFLTDLSRVTFGGLITFIIELSKDIKLEWSHFHDCFNLPTGIEPITESLTINDEILTHIENTIRDYQSRFSHSISEFDNMRAQLEKIGIREDNAYRFISGHQLEEIVHNLHTQLLGKLKDKETVAMRNSGDYQGKAISERKQQIDKTLTEGHLIHTYLTHPVGEDDEIHKYMLNRIRCVS